MERMADETTVAEAGTAEGVPAKRPRLEESGAQKVPTVLRKYLFDPEQAAVLRESYANAEVYPHCVIENVLEPSYFSALREEMIANLSSTFKETDLFKLYQTGDLANLDPNDEELASRLPNLIALRAAIYSPEFRSYLSQLAGCGPLSDRTDCSSNVYMHTCHLLCHDDVIGKRKVSFILYLTDPDEEWEGEDGGALELYPLASPGVPELKPTKCILPKPNRMAFFTVLPGRSFHAVQEVYTPTKPRLSISGWYHAEDLPQEGALASLQQLQTRRNDVLPPLTPSPSGPACPLSEWVNPVYLGDEAQAQIRDKFNADGSVLLHAFLKPDIANKISSLTRGVDSTDGLGKGTRPDYSLGEGQGWEGVGPTHLQRYLRFAGEGGCAAGQELAALRDHVFASDAFGALLAKLTGHRVSGGRAEARRFRAGLDYTLAHYGGMCEETRLDASLAFVAQEGEAADLWASGDVGGFECYVKADEENDGAEAAESYRHRPTDDEDEGLLNVNAATNALSLVLRDRSTMKFVKYVNCSAPGSRWDVAAEYDLSK